MSTPPEPEVSIVIVSYECREELRRCLAAIEAHAGLPVEVIVVDNASRDGSADAAAAASPAPRVLRSTTNEGFARANNRGLQLARAGLVLALNPDTELRPGCLAALRDALRARPDAAAAGPRTLNGDGTAQVSFGPPLGLLAEWRQRRLVRGLRRRRPWALREAARLAASPSEPFWVSGACLLARREALARVSGFDEGFFLYEEDVDLCLRLRRLGLAILFRPEAEVVHHLGRSVAAAATRARLEYHRSHLLYYRKHNGPLETGLLRAWIAALGAAAWLGAAGPGPIRRRRRGDGAALLRASLGRA